MTDLPLIAGRYQLLERLGAGGMGEVWKAQDLRFESRLVALKLLKDEETHRQDADNRTKLERSLREESKRGLLTAEAAESLLDEVLRSGRGAEVLHARVAEKADSRGHLSSDVVMSLFDELVDSATCAENARTRARLRRLFKDEANAVANLRHDNIVSISDYGEYNGLPFLTMSYIEGPTLARVIQRRVPFTRQRQLELMENLCAGLAYAHAQKLVHRDIKPANLIIDSVTGSLKILDFGIVRRLRAQSESTVGVAIGTLCYMSPEQIRGASVDHRSDIFSVGDVFYELLSRKMAFPVGEGGLEMVDLMQRIQHSPPQPIREWVPDVEPEIEEILKRALEKNPDDRYQSLVDMQADLARLRSEVENQNRTVRVRTPRAKTEQLILGAEAALASADSAKALELLDQALLSDPTNSEVAHLRVRAQALAREQTQQARARGEAETVARHVAEGQALLAARQPEQALAKAREAIALNRSDSAALDLSRRANAELRRLADIERAENERQAEAARAEAIRRELEAARAAEARRQREAQEREVAAAKAEAARQEQEAARLAQERQAEAARVEAAARAKLRQEQEAADQAEAARRDAERQEQEAADRRRQAAAFVGKAVVARTQGNLAAAIQALETAAVLTPDDPTIAAQLQLDREALARATAETQRHADFEAALVRARSLLQHDQTGSAGEALREAIRLDANNPQVAELQRAIRLREEALAERERELAAAHRTRREASIARWKRRWPAVAAAVFVVLAVPTGLYLYRRPVAPVTQPVRPGTLTSLVSVDIRPWARVRITGLGSATVPAHSDAYVTPFLVSLAPGQYHLDCENGGLNPATSFDISVEAGQALRVSQVMTGFDPNRVVDTLLGTGK